MSDKNKLMNVPPVTDQAEVKGIAKVIEHIITEEQLNETHDNVEDSTGDFNVDFSNDFNI